VALEILDQVPDVGTIIVPQGGGGLIAGIAAVLAEAAPHVRVVGVQAAAAAAYPASFAAGHPVSLRLGSTMADGIAVGTPGNVPFEILDRLHVPVRTVSEESMSRALLLLLERAKLVVEPSGAAGIAALMDDPIALVADGAGVVVPVLTGGNIDPLLLMRVIQHGMVAAGRYLQLRVRVDDRPGALATLLQTVAAADGNIMHVEHSHTDSALGVGDVMVALQVEAKGADHCTQIVERLRLEGFEVHT
jgi:threonine dehydratase